MDIFAQQIINGLTIGSLYALVALGYSMVYGVLKMVNFAHGELFMLGPMFSLFIMTKTGIVHGSSNSISGDLSALQIIGIVALCFIVGVAFSAILGLIMERIVYRPLRDRKASMDTAMIAALGLSLFLANATMLVFGNKQRGFPSILQVKSYTIGGATFSNMQLFIMGFAIVLLIGLMYLVNYTYIGRNFRAVALDSCAAGLMGVNVNAVVAFVFILGPGIGAASGVLYAMTYGQVYYLMGAVIGMKGWVAAIIGGIGNVKGAVVGGFVLGLFEVLGGGYLPLLTGGSMGAEYRNIFAFIMLIGILIFRPQGLFGKRGVA